MTCINKTYFIAAIMSCSLWSAGQQANAQSTHYTAATLGMGGGGTAYLDGYNANFVNPANLLLNGNDKPRFSFGLIGGISTHAGGSLANISVYNKYFTKGLTLKGDVAAEALDQWFGADPGNMRRVGVQVDVVPLGAAYRAKNWAASIAFRSRVLFDASVSRGFAELGIYGLDGDVFSTAKPVNLRMETLAFHEISAGYSRRLLSLPSLFSFAKNVKVYAGVAPKLLLGAHSSKVNFKSTLLLKGESQDEIDLIQNDFAYEIETTGEVADQLTQFYRDRQANNQIPDIGDYLDPQPEDFYQVKASGWGVDLGGTVEMDINVPVIGTLFRGREKLRVAVSLTDIGKVTFNDKVGRFTADDMLEWRGFELDEEEIDNEYDGDRGEYMRHVLEDSIATEVYGSFSPAGIDHISRHLPTMANFGAQLVMNRLSVAIDFGKGFLEEGTSSKRVSFATGAEYKLFGFMPFRVGMQTGGLASTSYSAGWGLEFRNFEFNLAAASVAHSANRGSNAGAAWSGLVFRF